MDYNFTVQSKRDSKVFQLGQSPYIIQSKCPMMPGKKPPPEAEKRNALSPKPDLDLPTHILRGGFVYGAIAGGILGFLFGLTMALLTGLMELMPLTELLLDPLKWMIAGALLGSLASGTVCGVLAALIAVFCKLRK